MQPTSYILLGVLLFLAGTAPAHALEDVNTACPYYGGHASIESKLGNERDITEGAVFLPVACNEETLLFSDLRFKGDNQRNREGNIGLGVRSLQDKGVVGVYGYFDRRKSGTTEKYHNQATGGAEYLTPNWEVRANGYVPLNGEKTVGSLGTVSDPFLQGSGIFIEQTAGGTISERGLWGGDIEAGYKIPQSPKPLWLHAGAFSFNGEDAPTVEGGRLRGTLALTDHVSLLAEGQYDDERGRQGWVGARLTLPFGAKIYSADPVRSRMTASPVRDVDIVTATKVTPGAPAGIFQVTNTESGTPQNVIYVDNSNTDVGGGTGTLENPFTTLAAAQSAMADHDIVYIASGLGDSTGMDSGFAIARNNVQVIGEGTAFIYDGTRLTSGAVNNPNGIILKAAGVKPILTNLTAVNISGDGIYITGTNTSLTGLEVRGAAREGIRLDSATVNSGTVTLQNLDINGSVSHAFAAIINGTGVLDRLEIDGVTASNNANAGARISLASATSSIGTIDIRNFTANDNTNVSNGRGIYINTSAGNIDTINLTDINTHRNAVQGTFLATTGAAGSISNININRLAASNNVSNTGLYLQSQGGALGYITAQNLTLTDNMNAANGFGLQIRSYSGGNITSALLSNVVSSGNKNGIFMRTEGGTANIDAVTIRSSNISNNREDGLRVNNDGNVLNVDLGSGTEGNNSIYGNGTTDTALYRDIRLDLNGGALTAQNNWWGQPGGPITTPGSEQIVSEGVCPGSCGTADTANPLGSDPNAP